VDSEKGRAISAAGPFRLLILGIHRFALENQVKTVFSPTGKSCQSRLAARRSNLAFPGAPNLAGFMPRILVAEDRASMRTTLRNLFTQYGKWDVCGEAMDGQQAIGAAIALKPDLVLLDYKMPNADGLRAASEIKQKLPETPIVLFTLYKTDVLESRAKRVGVRAVVGKEEGVIKLLRTIEEELGLPSSV